MDVLTVAEPIEEPTVPEPAPVMAVEFPRVVLRLHCQVTKIQILSLGENWRSLLDYPEVRVEVLTDGTGRLVR